MPNECETNPHKEQTVLECYLRLACTAVQAEERCTQPDVMKPWCEKAALNGLEQLVGRNPPLFSQT